MNCDSKDVRYQLSHKFRTKYYFSLYVQRIYGGSVIRKLETQINCGPYVCACMVNHMNLNCYRGGAMYVVEGVNRGSAVYQGLSRVARSRSDNHDRGQVLYV
jgi:hypothetical protein